MDRVNVFTKHISSAANFPLVDCFDISGTIFTIINSGICLLLRLLKTVIPGLRNMGSPGVENAT